MMDFASTAKDFYPPKSGPFLSTTFPSNYEANSMQGFSATLQQDDDLSKSFEEISASTVAESVRIHPLPSLCSGKFSRHFKIDESNVEVTSVDISAHGGYVLVGCSNGMIILFSTAISDHQGVLVGHIHAKGLHTNLLLTVKISEDCRFCFGGVMNGSSELLAIDMGRLPVESSNLGSKGTSRTEVDAELITIYSHFDPKLRGFGNASLVCAPKTTCKGPDHPTYRLVCGRARLLHIWQFCPESAEQWTCMYDVATNGNTIECIEFRDGGYEVLSKSVGANLRVWNLRTYETEPLKRPSYEDIPNSADVKSLLGGFALGGVYNFAVVKIGAPREANRDAFEMPERSIHEDNGQRRKRMMRQIEEVIGTSDAQHALVLCTDGGVMYFKNSAVHGVAPCLTEFSSLQRDPNVQSTWNLRRVGRDGDVILLRAEKLISPGSSSATGSGGQGAFTSISACRLCDAAPSEVKSTTLFLSDSKSWSPIGYYHDCSEVPQQMTLNDKDCTDSPNSGSMFSASSYSSKSKSNSTSAAVAVTPDETFITKKDYSSSNDSNNIHVNNYNTSNIKYSNLHSYSRSAIGNTTSISTSISNSTSNVTSAVTSSLSFVKPPLGPTGLKRLPLGVLKNSDNWQKISPHRTIQNKTNPGLPLILRSTNMKPLRPGAYVENIDENGNYVTPDVAHTAQTRGPHTKISPEDSIIRLISSKIISNGSPKTSINLKKGLKRMRTVSHNDLIPSSSSISSVVSDGIAARMITPTLATSTSTSTSLSLSISRISNIMSDNPLTSFAIEAEALAEADQKVEKEEEKKIAVTRDEHDSKKRKILILSEAPSIPQIEESKKIIPLVTESCPSTDLINEFFSLKSSWIASCRQLANSESIDWSELRSKVYPVQSSSSHYGESQSFSLGCLALERLGSICVEQDRLRAQFVIEICRLLGDFVKQAADKLSRLYRGVSTDIDGVCENVQTRTVEELIKIFKNSMASHLCRQELELKGAIAQDEIFKSSHSPHDSPKPRLTFRHIGIFHTALMFDSFVKEIIKKTENKIRHKIEIDNRLENKMKNENQENIVSGKKLSVSVLTQLECTNNNDSDKTELRSEIPSIISSETADSNIEE